MLRINERVDIAVLTADYTQQYWSVLPNVLPPRWQSTKSHY